MRGEMTDEQARERWARARELQKRLRARTVAHMWKLQDAGLAWINAQLPPKKRISTFAEMAPDQRSQASDALKAQGYKVASEVFFTDVKARLYKYADKLDSMYPIPEARLSGVFYWEDDNEHPHSDAEVSKARGWYATGNKHTAPWTTGPWESEERARREWERCYFERVWPWWQDLCKVRV